MKAIPHLLAFSFLLATALFSPAAPPSAVNYQGRFTNAVGVPQPGNKTMSLKIYDAAFSNIVLYSETIGNVIVDANGVYSFQFGASGAGTPASLANALAASAEQWLELTVDGAAQAPRQKILAVPFALMASGLPDGAVSSAMIANGAVGLSKITGLGTAATENTSTSGGANEVLKTDANGNLVISSTTLGGPWADLENSLVIGDWDGGVTRLVMMNTSGTDGGSIGFNTAHDAGGGELQISSPNRMALCLGNNGALQIGIATSSEFNKQFAYMQRQGDSTAFITTTKSLPLYFTASRWNGTATVQTPSPSIQAVPNGTTGDVFLDFANPATVPNGLGGNGTQTLAMRLSKNGLSIPVQTITDTNAVITKPLGDARYSAKALMSALSADTAGVTSSATKVDSGLSVTLATGVTYEITVMLSFTHSGTGGVRFQQNNTGTLVVIGGLFDSGAGGVVNQRIPFANGVGVDGLISEYTITGNASSSYLISGLYTATVGGLLKIQYAQSVSDAVATVMKNGSYITARPL